MGYERERERERKEAITVEEGRKAGMVVGARMERGGRDPLYTFRNCGISACDMTSAGCVRWNSGVGYG